MKIKTSNPYKLIVIVELSLLAGISLAYFTVQIPVLATKFLSLIPEFVVMKNSLREQQKIIQSLQFDNIRYKDMVNTALALQDFIREKGFIPDTLREISEAGYLDLTEKFIDPERGIPYFYQKREDGFIFCVYMSDRITGVNVGDCPPAPVKNSEKESKSMNSLNTNLSASVSDVISLRNHNEIRLLFSIVWAFWALLCVYLAYYSIKFAFAESNQDNL